ncbi:MAG: DMT family transporter [Deltaproteobacteria bacterium]|nr:DMT family transporter [Deltaproteobacteria bacterium]
MLEKKSPNPLAGIGFMITMTVCVSLLDASAKYLTGELSLWMILWGRYLFHFLFVTIFFFRGAPRDIVYTKKLKIQLLRSVLIFSAGVAFWGALKFMPMTDCLVIAFASPLFVAALSVPILKETVGMYRWGGIAIGLSGVVIVMRPGAGVFEWVSVLPLLAGFLYASFQITTRILCRTDNSLTTLMYSSVVGLLLSTAVVFFIWVPPTLQQWLLLIWMGFIGAVGHYLMIKAFELAPASLLAPFDYTGILWATFLGFFIFHDLPDAWTITGAAIIISSGIYIINRERHYADALALSK